MLKTAKHKTAILIFANSASTEFEQKPFAKSAALFEALNKETLAKVKKTKLPYFHFTEKEQLGTSFGERFVNAIQEVYQKGFDTIITIGNDSPQLKTAHLLDAYKQLQLGKTVLGPTFDGGFYLMGLHKANFDASLFERLPWQRFGLFNRISQLFENYNSQLFRLPVFEDIDTRRDVAILLNFTKALSSFILFLLNKISSYLDPIFPKQENTSHTNFSLSFYNKGSPIL
ncbi:hypothetical protein MTsPCn9_15030 [Croceitalea sp. MTPC9]|uniref:TIGR04282 family arsenosugar biosynthesis glycosyltransferase n=1 Tax=unclassified Croceitalea TaxID=2632280 RepID=UPI002B3E3706|nr:hypothetical protein MTsPCn6_14100 [Croceitalea sp. MTPC6]GMN16567.1 hypothetical protein MTsPCn9_15030 [Croceitalea sp. MTPC9]